MKNLINAIFLLSLFGHASLVSADGKTEPPYNPEKLYDHPVQMSVADFLYSLGGPDFESGSEIEYLRYTYAQGFLAGVKDGTKGQRWCHALPTGPQELQSEIYFYLKKQKNPQKLLAGETIVEMLSHKFPCAMEKHSS